VIDRFEGSHFYLSNFFTSPLTRDGETYDTVEHAFQAAKTFDAAERARVRDAATPAIAKRLGRQVTLRADWEKVKLGVMEDLLRAKFSDPELREALRATGGEELVEGNTWNDRFWGVCRGRGQNHLGRLLMKIRAEILAAERETGRGMSERP